MSLNIQLERVWTYAVEVVASGLVCLLLLIRIGGAAITKWQITKRSDLLILAGIAMGASAAVFAAYFGILPTEFGKRLRLHKAAAEYSAAFAFPMLLLAGTMVALAFLDDESGIAYSIFVMFLLCYSILNFMTMVRNVVGLVRLWQDIE